MAVTSCILRSVFCIFSSNVKLLIYIGLFGESVARMHRAGGFGPPFATGCRDLSLHCNCACLIFGRAIDSIHSHRQKARYARGAVRASGLLFALACLAPLTAQDADPTEKWNLYFQA